MIIDNALISALHYTVHTPQSAQTTLDASAAVSVCADRRRARVACAPASEPLIVRACVRRSVRRREYVCLCACARYVWDCVRCARGTPVVRTTTTIRTQCSPTTECCILISVCPPVIAYYPPPADGSTLRDRRRRKCQVPKLSFAGRGQAPRVTLEWPVRHHSPPPHPP